MRAVWSVCTMSRLVKAEKVAKFNMNWTLEVVLVPVTDVERAKKFYAEQVGFHLDFDSRDAAGNGPVQLTPPGSGCSIIIGKDLVDMRPGSLQGVQLVVADIHAAHAHLLAGGVAVSAVQVYDPQHNGGGFRPYRLGDALDNVGFVFFQDPDGNGWAVQQISSRGRGEAH